ncbi:MAG: hypothetical protein R3E98_10380 [Gemmatimonadota bacterium]|nr:hypothetical protein [Gemmatimonadota bacterium]
MPHLMRAFRSASVLALLAAVGCAEDLTPPAAVEAPLAPVAADASHASPGHAAASSTPAVRAWLRDLRRATAPYRRFRNAVAAGYGTAITGCMESDAGGMGFHYGDPTRLDDVVEPLRPELLLYVPGPGGDLRFVAVEYAVPFTAWSAPHPPEIAGVPFHRNETFGLWILHAWVGQSNPAGILMDWNPTVSCRWAH